VSNTVISWVEQLLPPFGAPKKRRKAVDGMGAAIARFDLATGEASAIRPFVLDIDNQSLTMPLGPVGLAGIDDDDQYWFACYPNAADYYTEGLCYMSMA